jgi:uncharacterized membrane protein YhiD involved in acid resistance
MQTLTTLEFFTRLAVGLGCGALIGAERQWRARMAGLRTNALVSAGATLFVRYSDIKRQLERHSGGGLRRVRNRVPRRRGHPP